MPEKLKAIWRKDPVSLSFLEEGMAGLASNNTLVVCIVENCTESNKKTSNQITIIASNEKNAKMVQEILADNAIKLEGMKIFNRKKMVGFTLQESELDKLEGAFKRSGMEIDKIERKEIKM